ncbi:MAG: peptidase [Pseudomonadales bacterium]|nr:peptidase [Pseudomonadales bacterium]
MYTHWARIYKGVHTWTGLLAGMALFIAFYAGALTVFKEPITRWASPPAPAANWVALEQTPALIRQILNARPQVGQEFFVELHPQHSQRAQLRWQVAGPEADEHDQLSRRHFMATLDAAGGAVTLPLQPAPVAELIDVLHRVVGLPFDTEYNRWLMGVVALLYAVALLSGLVILLPTLSKDLFAFRPGRNRKRLWLDAHNLVGLVSLPFHLVIALTAVGFAFHDGIYTLQDKVVHDGGLGRMFRAGMPAPDPESRSHSELLPPGDLLDRFKVLAPELEPTRLQYLRIDSPMPMVSVWANDPVAMNARAWGSFAVLHPYTGAVLNTDYLPAQQGPAFAAINTIFSLHFVTFGGAVQKWVYFGLALAGAWLFYTGNLLWVESRRRAQRRHQSPTLQPPRTQWVAALTVGVCLGSVAGISVTLAAAKWLPGCVEDLLLAHQLLYYGVFFGSLAWAIRLDPARGAVHLLWLAAGATAAIPGSSLLGALGWVPGLWWYPRMDSLGVDLTAMVAALGFFLMARRLQQRISRGPSDSVWGELNARGYKGNA